NPTPLGDYVTGAPLKLFLTQPGDPPPAPLPGSFVSDANFLNGLPRATFGLQSSQLGRWTIEVRDADIHSIAPSLWKELSAANGPHFRLNSEIIEDIIVVCHYSVS